MNNKSILKLTAMVLAAAAMLTACNSAAVSSSDSASQTSSVQSASENSKDESADDKSANPEKDKILSEAIPLTELPYTPDAVAMDKSNYKYVKLCKKAFGEYSFVLVANALNISEDSYIADMELIVTKNGKALPDSFIPAHSDGSQGGTTLYKNDSPEDILKLYTLKQNGKEYPLVIVRYKCNAEYAEGAETLSRFFSVVNDEGIAFHDSEFMNYINLPDDCYANGRALVDRTAEKALIFNFENNTAKIEQTKRVEYPGVYDD